MAFVQVNASRLGLVKISIPLQNMQVIAQALRLTEELESRNTKQRVQRTALFRIGMDLDQFKKVPRPQVSQTKMLVASMSCPGQLPAHPYSSFAPCFLDHVGILHKPASKYTHSIDALPSVFLFSQVGSKLLLCLVCFVLVQFGFCFVFPQEFWYVCKNYMLTQGKEGKQECMEWAGVLLWVTADLTWHRS